MKKIQKALISVSDKKNLKDLLKVLTKNKIELISSGGTYKEIRRLKYRCLEVSKYTNSPEILGGRVKTLHPKIHAGILSKRNDKSHRCDLKDNNFQEIDLVIVNFYPFEKTLEKTKNHSKIIENIELCPIKNSAKLINEWPTKDNNLIKADYFIVTSGAWVSMIKPKYTNKIYPVRGQMIQYKASELKINHILYSDDFYILQRKDGVIIAGSTVEEVGFDDKITIESIDYLKKKSESLIPELKNIIVENHWSGFRPGSKNNIPITNVGRETPSKETAKMISLKKPFLFIPV